MQKAPSYLSSGAISGHYPPQSKNKGFFLLSHPDSNPKTKKALAYGYLDYILHLAPADLSGVEMCHWRSPGCTSGCLNTAGHGGLFPSIGKARVRKTNWFNEDRESFMAALVADVQHAIKLAAKQDMLPAFRLNGTSDVLWERVPVAGADSIMELFPDIPFYDYTKAPAKLRRDRPANYSLTFSLNEENQTVAKRALAEGMNVAAVFRHANLPDTLWGYPVINGDLNDLRFLDPVGSIVGLKAKGKARKDQSGFVLESPEIMKEAA